MSKVAAKALATVAAAFSCMYWMYFTHGTSGIGWFIWALILIW